MPRKPTYKLPEGIASIKEFRSQVAKLKKRGLISKTIDARKVRPEKSGIGPGLINAIRKFAPVIQGKAQVVTIKGKSKKERAENAAKLKAQGFEVARGKAVIKKTQTLTKSGAVIDRGARSAKARLKFGELESELLSMQLKPNERVGVKIFGNPQIQLYESPTDLVAQLLADYDPRLTDDDGEEAFSLVVVKDTDEAKYLRQAARNRSEAQKAKRSKARKANRRKGRPRK